MEYSPEIARLNRGWEQQRETGEWFKQHYGAGASIRVLGGPTGGYDTTVTNSSVQELPDGTTKFSVEVVVDGQYHTYTSDRPDNFEGLELL